MVKMLIKLHLLYIYYLSNYYRLENGYVLIEKVLIRAFQQYINIRAPIISLEVMPFGGGGPKLRKAIKFNIKFTILLKWVDLSLFDILKFVFAF